MREDSNNFFKKKKDHAQRFYNFIKAFLLAADFFSSEASVIVIGVINHS